MLVPHLYCVDPSCTVPHYTLRVQWAYLLVSGFIYSELEIFQFISVGYSHVHVMWFHHFYMNQSVQFSFFFNSKTVVLNSPTHIAIHRNKKQKKLKLSHNNILLFLYRFLSSLIRKGSLTSCEEELREVRWFQVDFDVTNNHRQKCWELKATTLYLFSFFSAPGPLLNKIQFIIIIIIWLFPNIELGRVIKGEKHLFWTSKWTTVKFYSLCNNFCPRALVDFLFSLSPKAQNTKEIESKTWWCVTLMY